MKELFEAAGEISLFCRLNINVKRELPIRSSEMGMLIFLCKVEGDKTPMDIAAFFKVSKAMATNMITSMYNKGYIEKCPSEKDHRKTLIIPTDQAKALVDDTYEEYYKTMHILQNEMGEEEFRTMIQLLRKANGILLNEK